MTNPTADAAKLLPCPLSDDQIRYMVDQFLGWRLPKPWHPDNGISYVRPNYMHPPADHDWPTGTNLFDYTQAEAMVRHMVEGLPTENTRPQRGLRAGESDFGGITLVRQKNPSGCVIASLAMVTGNSYDDILVTYPWAHDGCDMETVGSDYLYRCGIAWQRIYINQTAPRFENHHRAEWPPKPWAPAHLCMVETSQAHCVVMKSDGTVLDPLTDEPRTLADYRKVMQVWGLYRLGLAARPKVEDVALPKGLVDALRRQRQLDEGGEEVAVNRQACDEAADLLERLAMKATSLEARDIGWSLQCQEAEAELAKADADFLDYGGHTIDCAVHEHNDCDCGLTEVRTIHKKRHAARQQQRASEAPTGREGE